MYELPPVIGILIHAHLAVLIIIRSLAHRNLYVGKKLAASTMLYLYFWGNAHMNLIYFVKLHN